MHIRFKKLASVLLSFAIIGGAVFTSQFSAFAHETVNQNTVNNTTSLSDSYEYKINEDGTAEITKYTGLESELTIPSELDGYKVCKIAEGTFFHCENLSSITVPDSVTEIKTGAFGECTNLTDIKLSENLTHIDDGVFHDCINLKSIVLPNSLKLMAKGVFENCTSLEEIKLPDNLNSIGVWSFKNCSNLKSIVVPDSVTNISNMAFENCTNLEKIVIPTNVSWISTDTFKNCDKVTIYGYGGSYAQTYADENNIPFVDMGIVEPTTVAPTTVKPTDIEDTTTVTENVSDNTDTTDENSQTDATSAVKPLATSDTGIAVNNTSNSGAIQTGAGSLAIVFAAIASAVCAVFVFIRRKFHQ